MKKTEVVNVKLGQHYDVYIGRGSIWGNPFSHLKSPNKAEFYVQTREESIRLYEKWFINSIDNGDITIEQIKELKGKRLGCFCKPEPCHGDVIVRYLEEICQD